MSANMPDDVRKLVEGPWTPRSEAKPKPIDDGGPAFPVELPSDLELIDAALSGQGAIKRRRLHPGMSLRAWLAGQALAGVLAAEDRELNYDCTTAARLALGFADALIAELKKEPKP